MQKIFSLFALLSLLLISNTSYSEELASEKQSTNEPTASDHRQLVSMPEQTRQLMREDMLNHLVTMNEILGYLAESNFSAASEVAETKMGKSSMGKHRGTGMGPGRFMPLEMRNIGWGMHDAATEFSKIAKEGDLKSAYRALQNVTASCVECHYSYRTR